MTPEKKFTRRSCRDLNPPPFKHESGALAISAPGIIIITEGEIILTEGGEARAPVSWWTVLQSGTPGLNSAGDATEDILTGFVDLG